MLKFRYYSDNNVGIICISRRNYERQATIHATILLGTATEFTPCRLSLLLGKGVKDVNQNNLISL